MRGKSVCLSVCLSAPSRAFPVAWLQTPTAAFESLGLRYVPHLPPKSQEICVIRKRSGENIIFEKSGKMTLGHADSRYL